MKGKKAFSLIGIIVSALIVIAGILTMSGVFGGYGSSVSYIYDFGYASFGADFYSYVNNNAARASYTLINLIHFMRVVSGIFMICIGLLSLCHFGIARSECTAAKKNDRQKPQAEAESSCAAPLESEAPDSGAGEDAAAPCDNGDIE